MKAKKVKPVTPEERAAIIAALEEAPQRSIGGIAKAFRRGKATVMRIRDAAELGRSELKRTEAAAKANIVDSETRKIGLSIIFLKGVELAYNAIKANDYQKASLGVAIAVDKLRLEEGKATERTENISAPDLSGLSKDDLNRWRKLQSKIKDA